MNQKAQWALTVVVSMVLGAAAIVGIDAARDDDGGGGTTTAVQTPATAGTSNTNGSSAPVARTASDIADLVEQIRPSIVEIDTAAGRGATTGLGSGIVLDKEGNILTNNHVVRGFDALDVTLWDGTSAAARVIGTDAGNDLALIRIDDVPAEKLHPATLGDSDGVRLGELVIAIGNPFGRSGSVTEGIVSGIDRTLSGGTGRPLRQLIQTDAAINPGNSGGALFNARGEVIGITTAIENPSGNRTFVGIGYAVPINIAARAMSALMAGERIQHPRLGIGVQDLTPALAASMNVPVEQGIIVTAVEANSAAQKAGIRAGRTGQTPDIITRIDNTEIKNYEDLAQFLDTKNVGDTVQVHLIRDGREITLDLTLEAWQDTSA
jgi:putative serine protease PepD